MPAVLVTEPTVTQNSSFLPQQWPWPSLVLIVPTHEGMARLSWPGWLIKYQDGANETRRGRINLLMCATPLPLSQTGTFVGTKAQKLFYLCHLLSPAANKTGKERVPIGCGLRCEEMFYQRDQKAQSTDTNSQ